MRASDVTSKNKPTSDDGGEACQKATPRGRALMKIALRGMGFRELLDELEASGASELVGGIHDQMFFDSFWPNPQLDEFLREAADRGSLDLNPWMEFDQREIEQSRFLRIRSRKVLSDSPADFERMRADLGRLSWLGGDPKRRYRVPERISLSKIRLKPNQIASVGQWTAECVVPKGVRAIFEEARLSGVDFRPVFNTRTGAAFDEYFHLYSDRALEFRELDLASPEIRSPHPEEQGYDALGCLCYDTLTLERALDFNRTGEPLESFEFPDWVVRSSVRDCFVEHRLRGWAFEPVLELGTLPYEEYCELWLSFYRLLGQCGEHTIRNNSVGPA
jgi:hypothetical protein